MASVSLFLLWVVAHITDAVGVIAEMAGHFAHSTRTCLTDSKRGRVRVVFARHDVFRSAQVAFSSASHTVSATNVVLLVFGLGTFARGVCSLVTQDVEEDNERMVGVRRYGTA